jgi:hypothetical protein
MPTALFVDELTTAYPDAKVILSNRDPDNWLTLMYNTIMDGMACNWKWIAPYDPRFAEPLRSMLDVLVDALMARSIETIKVLHSRRE